MENVCTKLVVGLKRIPIKILQISLTLTEHKIRALG